MAAEGPERSVGLSRSGQQHEHPSRQSFPPHPVRCQPSIGPLGSVTGLEKKLYAHFFFQSWLHLPIMEACKHKWTRVSSGEENTCLTPRCTITTALVVSFLWRRNLKYIHIYIYIYNIYIYIYIRLRRCFSRSVSIQVTTTGKLL